MTGFIQDLRYALRQLMKSPGFTLTAILTLALGVGATAAVFGVVRSVLLEPLPYADPQSLVGVAFSWPHSQPNAEQTGPAAEFIRDHSDAFTSVAIMDDSGPSVNLSVNEGHPMQVTALRVSEGYFRTLGTLPALGRGFVADEDRRDGARAVVLSNGLWTQVFNRDPGVVGQTIHLNEDSFTVVGVMPAGFVASAASAPGVLGTPELWEPLQLSEKDPGYDGDNYEMIGRLKPGITLAQLQQQLTALQQPFYQRYPTYKQWTNETKAMHEFKAWGLQDVVVSDVRRSLLTVLGAVMAVLLIACLNLTGLITARAMGRSREIALRSALGATRAQLLRLVVCEGLLLALGGGGLAVLVAGVGTNVLLHAAPMAIPTLHGVPNPWMRAGEVMLISLAATAIFSTIPAWSLLRNSTREMRVGGPSLGDTISQTRVSRSLMVAQVALAMVLVSTASVLLGTFVKLQSIPSGVEPRELTVFQVTLKGDHYATTQHTSKFIEAVLDQLRQSPGVDRVAAVNGLPLDRGMNDQGYPRERLQLERSLEFRPVSAGYLQTMGIPIIIGRDITESDRAGGEPVAVIGQTAAKQWWPGRSPIGDFIHVGGKHDWRIVGVAADVHTHSLVEDRGFVVYAPMVQLSDEMTSALNGWFPTSFVVRTVAHVNAASMAQQAVERADPEIPVAKLTSMQAVIDNTVAEPRFFSLLATGFSIFAVGLTVIGLFGLLSYQVTKRTREIGVRMALGADRIKILNSFLLRGLAVASLGVVVGIALSLAMRPVIGHLLSDSGVALNLASTDIVMSSTRAILFAVTAILGATLAASWLPARRAASVEPMEALRAE